MEDRQREIGIFIDPDRDLHIMEPVHVGRELKAPALIPHGIVIGDAPFFLHAENLRKVRPNPWDEGHAGFRRRHRKAPVVGREKLLREIPASPWR